jgi:hypothetical protein
MKASSDLDFEQAGAVADGYGPPGVPGDAERVHALGDHADAVPELLGGHLVGDRVTDRSQRTSRRFGYSRPIFVRVHLERITSAATSRSLIRSAAPAARSVCASTILRPVPCNALLRSAGCSRR